MSFALTVTLNEPDDAMITAKVAELTRIERKIARKEAEMQTLRQQISAFFLRYANRVGHLMNELSELEAQVSELWRKDLPEETLKAMEEDFIKEMQDQARAFQAHIEAEQGAGRSRQEQPEDLKTLYRMACRRIHPDRAENDLDRKRRNRAMSEVNRAYREGNAARIRQVLQEFVASNDTDISESRSGKLMRLICRIAEAAVRLAEVKRELKETKHSEMNCMRRSFEAQEKAGQDPFAEMERELKARIREVRAQLREMQAA